MGEGDLDSVHPDCPVKVGLCILKIGKQGHSGLSENTYQRCAWSGGKTKSKNQCQYLIAKEIGAEEDGEHALKLNHRTYPHSSVSSSFLLIFLKRESRKALISAYSARPSTMGMGSKFPMQPRRRG